MVNTMNSNLLSKPRKNFQPRRSRGWFWLILIAVMIIAGAVAPAIVVIGIERGGKYIWYGYLAALGLHLFMNAPTAMYQLQSISFELYNVSILIPFVLLAVIFERLRRLVRAPKDDQSGNEVVYWQRHVTEDQSP